MTDYEHHHERTDLARPAWRPPPKVRREPRDLAAAASCWASTTRSEATITLSSTTGNPFSARVGITTVGPQIAYTGARGSKDLTATTSPAVLEPVHLVCNPLCGRVDLPGLHTEDPARPPRRSERHLIRTEREAQA